MRDKLHLIIYTPTGKRFDDEVDFVQIHGYKNYLGILPNHAPLISDVIVSKMSIRINGEDIICAVGEGVVSIDNGEVKVVVSSFEKADEIDVNRALRAKERAEKRLEEKLIETDILRAKAALSRALNRIEIAGNSL